MRLCVDQDRSNCPDLSTSRADILSHPPALPPSLPDNIDHRVLPLRLRWRKSRSAADGPDAGGVFQGS